MLKVVVFDGGYGGEFFADELEAALPVVDVTRVIEWRHAETILKNPRHARKIAESALRPYIGSANLIIFANHLLAATSLKYFAEKYRSQRFLGLSFAAPDTFVHRDTLILATKAVAKTRNFRKFVVGLNRPYRVLTPDNWVHKIDDGDLRLEEIKYVIGSAIDDIYFRPSEAILACSQFSDIKEELKAAFGYDIRIYDSFAPAIREVAHLLGLRGGTGTKKS